MRCPRCWTDNAFMRDVHGWGGVLLACLLLVPMKCHHCYHKFSVFWPLTIGKELDPPRLKFPSSARLAASGRRVASAHAEGVWGHSHSVSGRPTRADAA